MTPLEMLYVWKNHTFFDKKTKEELEKLNIEDDAEEIEDRFCKELEFENSGFFGLMGAGTNRVNIYTIGKIVGGYSLFLLALFGRGVCARDGVVIGYDTRNNSKLFSLIASKVLSGFGIKVYLLNKATSASELGFAIRQFNALGGVMITAGHLSSKFNGCKLYDEYGCLIEQSDSSRIIDIISKINFYDEIDYSGELSLIQEVDVSNLFVSEVLKISKCNMQRVKANLKIMFTPLHGTGYSPIMNVLERDGFVYIGLVEEDTNYNAEFPTCFSMENENNSELDIAISSAEEKMSDIVIGTDSDCGRLGVAVRHNGKFVVLNGNQIGVLLLDYLLTYSDLNKLKKPAIVKSIVTSGLANEIAKKYKVTTIETLSGFKHIGKKPVQFERAKKQELDVRNYDFIFGYEESFGYLVGDYVRDKDAVGASMLICEFASILKYNKKTLVDRLNEMTDEFGYFYDYQETISFKKEDAEKKVEEKMNILRFTISPFFNTKKIIDYNQDVEANYDFGKYPKDNMIKFLLEDDSWIVVKTSNFEKELKIYYNIRANSEREAKIIFQKLQLMLKTKLEL